MKYFYLFIFFIFPSCYATDSVICISIFNLKGVTSTASDNYSFEDDGFTGKEFQFFIRSNKITTSDVDENELNFVILNSELTLLGTYSGNNKESTIETWAFDYKKAKVYFNRSRVGFPYYNGNSAYIGDIKKCTK